MQNQQHFFSSLSPQRKETLSSEDTFTLLSLSTKTNTLHLFVALFCVCLRQGLMKSKLVFYSL